MIGVTSGYKVGQNVRCKHGSSMKDVHSGHNTWWWFCHLLAHIAKETTSLQPLYVIRSRQVVGRQIYLLPSFIFLAWVICIKGHLVEQMFNPFWQIFNSFIFPFARTIFLLAQSQAKVKSAKEKTQKSQNISHTTLTFFWVPIWNSASDLRILHSNALPLSHRDSMVSEACYEVHIWHASYILLFFTLTLPQDWWALIPQPLEDETQLLLVCFEAEAFCQHASCTSDYQLHLPGHLSILGRLCRGIPLHCLPAELFCSVDRIPHKFTNVHTWIIDKYLFSATCWGWYWLHYKNKQCKVWRMGSTEPK